MDFPDMDFLGEKKGLVVAGAVGVLAIFAIGKRSGGGSTKQQTATIIPPEGVTWGEIAGARGRGVIGNVGPGEPVRGDSAYEQAVKGGFKGTMEDWIQSLRGLPGSPGAPGKSAPVPDAPKPSPGGWKPRGYPREIDPTGKPYGCPMGFYLGNESTGSGNHVCILTPPGTREIRVVYKKAQAGEAETNPGGTVKVFDTRPSRIGATAEILVKNGDTMKSLATRGYGDPTWGELLKQKNPGRKLIVGEKWRL